MMTYVTAYGDMIEIGTKTRLRNLMSDDDCKASIDNIVIGKEVAAMDPHGDSTACEQGNCGTDHADSAN